MGQPFDAAVERGRDLYRMLSKDRPSLVKAFVDLSFAYNLISHKDSEGSFYGEKLSPQDLLASLICFAELEGSPCNHPTYGLANLPVLVRKKVEEVYKRVIEGKMCCSSQEPRSSFSMLCI